MDSYIASCVAMKINGCIIELIAAAKGTNTPNTIDNVAPFVTPNNFSTPNNAYFNRVDYFVQKCKDNGIVVWMWPVYLGNSAGEGWQNQYNGDTQAHRQAWGTFVGNRYKTFGNVVLVHGGDTSSSGAINDYITTLNAAWPGALQSYHAQRTVSAYAAANGQSWLNLNNIYIDDSGAGAFAAAEYARSPVRPVFMVENYYETASGSNSLWDSFSAICGGCLGGISYGNENIWAFGGPGAIGADPNYARHYTDTGRTKLQYVRKLIDQYAWWKLVPKRDGSLVSSSLGSGLGAVSPAMAADGTFAWIFSDSNSVTLVRSAFSGVYSNIRIQAYSPDNGTFGLVSAAAPTTGTQTISVSGRTVIVVDGG